jgi:hypothetical protein
MDRADNGLHLHRNRFATGILRFTIESLSDFDGQIIIGERLLDEMDPFRQIDHEGRALARFAANIDEALFCQFRGTIISKKNKKANHYVLITGAIPNPFAIVGGVAYSTSHCP